MVVLIILAAFTWEPNPAQPTGNLIGQTHNSELDPEVGQVIPLGDSLKGLEPADRVLVIGIAVCSECASIKADVPTIGKGFARVIGVFQGDRSEFGSEADTDYIASFDAALFWKPSEFATLNGHMGSPGICR